MPGLHAQILEILHFGLSMVCQPVEPKQFATAAARIAPLLTNVASGAQQDLRAAIEDLAEATLRDRSGGEFPVREFATIMRLTGLDLNRLFVMYAEDSVLTLFRRAHADHPAGYPIVWGDEPDATDDRGHLRQIVAALDPDSESFIAEIQLQIGNVFQDFLQGGATR